MASPECLKEWHRAKTLESRGHLLFRVPIIIRPCAWKELLAGEAILALPKDGKAITAYPDADTAWLEVHNGIKAVVEALHTTFTPKSGYFNDLKGADIPSSQPISLDDIFVFPRLVKRAHTSTSDLPEEKIISSVDELYDEGKAVLYGHDKCGKTALAQHLALSLLDNSKPVLFADLRVVKRRLDESYIRSLYKEQLNGDYYLWRRQEGKTLIIDNMTEAPGILEFIDTHCTSFAHIFLFVSSDVFHSYLHDDIRLAEFQEIRLDPMTRTQQEALIRKRLPTLDKHRRITDGFVDEVEDRVNSIIISNRIVPRYPFFILSILQTYDASMPRDLSITSYGHCYYVFIIASLIRAGIAKSDDAVNSCFNFAEQLSLATFRASRENNQRQLDFRVFLTDYCDRYIIKKSILNRMMHKDYGLIGEDGTFRTAYMYYYFLGKALATSRDLAEGFLPELCAHSYTEENYLILLFAIHHATDDKIVEDIAYRTMLEFDDIPCATLSKEETSRFRTIVTDLPKSVLSDDSVEQERARERQTKQELEEERDHESDEEHMSESEQLPVRMLRVLKNNRILGQVLRNQYGKLLRTEIEDIVETIADSSFRLVNLVLGSEEEILTMAQHIHAKYPEADLDGIRWILRAQSFLWTIYNIEDAVRAVSVPSIRDAVDAVVLRNSTPVYELFGFFYQLDSGEELTNDERDILADLFKRHHDDFIRLVLSIRTQFYMNTHRSRTSVEQSICSILGIRYKPRLRSAR